MNTGHDITSPMSYEERRASIGLSSIYAFRMLGLFMILPVFSLFAKDLHGSTPLLTGFAIGAYGLTQAIFQIPFGMLSDRYGRKSIIAVGLAIFAVGSLIAAFADSIYGVIAGRALQGAGAIAAALMALAADLTRETQRTKAMAMIGITIGMSFVIAVVIGPVIASWVGLRGIFTLTAGLGLFGIILLYGWVPNPAAIRFHHDTEPVPKKFRSIVKNAELLRLNFGIFILHFILTALFVVLPLSLINLNIEGSQHWQIYLPVLLCSMAACLPLVVFAEKKRKIKPVFLTAISLIVIANLLISNFNSDLAIITGLLFLFFTGFNILEATLPSLISKIAPIDLKGTALGVYSTCQFLGAFCGGLFGGWTYGSYGIATVFLFSGIAAIIWLFVAASMNPPIHLSSLVVSVGISKQTEATRMSEQIAKIEGVAEVVVLVSDGVAYLKVDKERLDRDRLNRLIEHV